MDCKACIGVHLYAGMKVERTDDADIKKRNMNLSAGPSLMFLCVFGEEIVSERAEIHIKRSNGSSRAAVGLLAFVAFFGQLGSSEAVGYCVHVIRVTGTRCQNSSETVKSCESVHNKCIASPMKHEPLMETTRC